MLELRGLVSCHNRSWDPPFRAFPSRRSRAPLEAAGSPAVIRRRAETRCSTPCHRWFHRRPRFHVFAWIPHRLWTPFPRTKARFPVVPGFAQRNRFVPPASPASKLCSLRKTVPTTPGCPSAAGRDSRGFYTPLRSFLLPRLGLSTRPGLMDLNTHLRPKTPACDSKDRSPPSRVRPS
jgi:hypothetical protein